MNEVYLYHIFLEDIYLLSSCFFVMVASPTSDCFHFEGLKLALDKQQKCIAETDTKSYN